MRQLDIAKKLNISRTTVSRALNGEPMKEETREMVLAAAKELGYVTNKAAASLASKKEIIIHAFLTTSVVSGYSTEIKRGIKSVLDARNGFNFTMVFHYVNINKDKKQDQEQMKNITETLSEEKVDGVLLTPLSFDNLKETEMICLEKDIPLITLDMPFYSNQLSHIGPDYTQIGRITAGLICNSIRKEGNILLLTFDEGYQLNNTRIDGFYDKMKEQEGITVHERKLNSLSKDEFTKVLNKALSNNEFDAIYTTFKTELICEILKEKDLNDYVIVCNDINNKIKKFLDEGLVTYVLYQRPFYQGATAADSFYKYFFDNTLFEKGISHSGSDIVFKENLNIL